MDIHREKKNPDLNLTRYTKINSKRATGLHIKCEIVNFERRKRRMHVGCRARERLVGLTRKAKENKSVH